MLLGITNVLLGSTIDLKYYFDYDYFRFDSGPALFNAAIWVLSAVLGSFYLCVVVERAKKCLDFTTTYYFIHLLCSCLYSGEFPLNWHWWAVTVLAATLMTTLGEQLCMRIELRDIKIDEVFDGFLVAPDSPQNDTSSKQFSNGGRRSAPLFPENAMSKEGGGLSPPPAIEKRKTSDHGGARSEKKAPSRSLSPKSRRKKTTISIRRDIP